MDERKLLMLIKAFFASSSIHSFPSSPLPPFLPSHFSTASSLSKGEKSREILSRRPQRILIISRSINRSMGVFQLRLRRDSKALIARHAPIHKLLNLLSIEYIYEYFNQNEMLMCCIFSNFFFACFLSSIEPNKQTKQIDIVEQNISQSSAKPTHSIDQLTHEHKHTHTPNVDVCKQINVNKRTNKRNDFVSNKNTFSLTNSKTVAKL